MVRTGRERIEAVGLDGRISCGMAAGEVGAGEVGPLSLLYANGVTSSGLGWLSFFFIVVVVLLKVGKNSGVKLRDGRKGW